MMWCRKIFINFLLAIACIYCQASDSVSILNKEYSFCVQQFQQFSKQQVGVENIEVLAPENYSHPNQLPALPPPFEGNGLLENNTTNSFTFHTAAIAQKQRRGNLQFAFWNSWSGSKKKPIVKDENWGKLRNHHSSVWKKVWRGEMLIGGAELVGMGILMAMPKEVTKWPEDWAADATRNIHRAFTTAPVVDEDDWQMNYVGHPLAGSLYYNTIRSQNANWFQSFLFSAAQSVIWEYVVEGIAEQPSIQDLIITPVSGSILGEACHQLTLSMRKKGFTFTEKVVTLLLNPMYVINNGFGPRFNPPRMKKM